MAREAERPRDVAAGRAGPPSRRRSRGRTSIASWIAAVARRCVGRDALTGSTATIPSSGTGGSSIGSARDEQLLAVADPGDERAGSPRARPRRPRTHVGPARATGAVGQHAMPPTAPAPLRPERQPSRSHGTRSGRSSRPHTVRRAPPAVDSTRNTSPGSAPATPAGSPG